MRPIRTSGRVNQDAPLVAVALAATELPRIGVEALLQLADWYHARGQTNPPGGSTCVNHDPLLSPPAPAQAETPRQSRAPVGGAARRPPRTNPQRPVPRGG